MEHLRDKSHHPMIVQSLMAQKSIVLFAYTLPYRSFDSN